MLVRQASDKTLYKDVAWATHAAAVTVYVNKIQASLRAAFYHNGSASLADAHNVSG